MKKILIFSGLLLLFSLEAKCASVPIIYSNGEELHVIEEKIDGYYDYGVFYKQFQLFWIPIWNYDKKPVLIKNDMYWDLTYEGKLSLRRDYGIDTSDLSIPFWEAYGGKLLIIVLLIVAYFIWFRD